MKKSFIGAALIATLFSCESEINDVASVQDAKVNKTSINLEALFSEGHKVSQEDAEGKAQEAISMFYENKTQLRSMSAHNVETVRYLTREKSALRSGSAEESLLPDTLAYMFNFGNNEGYAIISADNRIGQSVLACTESGSLDSTQNPGVQMFLNQAATFAEMEILEFERTKDSLLSVIMESASDDSINTSLRAGKLVQKITTAAYEAYLYEEILDSVIFGPFVKVNWGQGYPYNIAVPVSCSNNYSDLHGKAYAGCGNTAVAMIMSHWKYPTKYSWTKMLANASGKLVSEEGKSNIAWLFQDIFNNNSQTPSYKCSGTSTTTDSSLEVFKRMGYNATLKTMDTNEAIKWLQTGHPLWVRGSTPEDKGHAWVWDGFLQLTVRTTLIVKWNALSPLLGRKTSTQVVDADRFYIHNNWGWDGSGNGYFAQGCYNTWDPRYYDRGVRKPAFHDLYNNTKAIYVKR